MRGKVMISYDKARAVSRAFAKNKWKKKILQVKAGYEGHRGSEYLITNFQPGKERAGVKPFNQSLAKRELRTQGDIHAGMKSLFG
jgi:hypothetical protein